MPVVRRIRRRGATITVESHAEVLFMPGGSINGWAAKFTGQLRARTIKNAPTNVRPRWGHYGKPLKQTIVSARPRFWGNGKDRQRVYAAVGSTAPYAYYVDQGTGIYGGSGPYPAKVLPPWSHGDASLYESTWRPGGPGTRRVEPVMIKGQRPQFFFDKSLRETMHHMRLSAFQVPTSPKITDAMNSVATGLENFLGNTPADSGFRASLEEWRAWRDEAFSRGEALNRSRYNAAAALKAHNRRAAAKQKARGELPDNVKAFLATKAAADRRKKAQQEALRKQREAKALGKKRQAEKEERDRRALAKRAAARTFEKARLKAYQYMHAIEKAYPDAQVQISKDKSMIRVHYTGPGGEVRNEYFLH
jgi:hypothetical protein